MKLCNWWRCVAFFLVGVTMKAAEAVESPEASDPAEVVVISPALIDQLAAEARTNHPGVQAAVLRAKAEALGVETVRTWEDPTASFGGEVFQDSSSVMGIKMGAAEEGDLIYGVQEKLPLWGLPRLTREVAVAGAARSEAAAEARYQELRRLLAHGLLQLALTEKTVQIGEQDLAWLELTTRAVENKYGTGQSPLADVLQLQNEQAERNDELITERRQLANDQIHLNEILNRSLHSAWPALELPGVIPAIPFSQKLLSLALTNDPQLKISDQEIAQARAQMTLTRRTRLPDVSVGVEGRQYTGDGDFRSGTFMVSFSLPWGNAGKYRQDYERTRWLAGSAEADRAEEVLNLEESLHHVTMEIEADRRRALLYDGEITVRAGQLISSRLNDWATGRGSLREVLDARRSLLDSQLTGARAREDEYQMLTELMLLTGANHLSDILPLADEPEIHHFQD